MQNQTKKYLRAGVAAGIDIDAIAPRLSFFWAIGMNHFMGNCQDACCTYVVGEDCEAVQPEELEVIGSPYTLPDIRLVTH